LGEPARIGGGGRRGVAAFLGGDGEALEGFSRGRKVAQGEGSHFGYASERERERG
jgi:hypothetical protein